MNFYNVLIVDDETIIREGLKKHIDWENLGMKVCGTADSAEAALACAESTPPDILITDIRMRGRDGINLVEDLLERGITPLVILISSYNDFSYAQRAVHLSVVREYILKPVDLPNLVELLARTRQELDRRSNLPEPVPVATYRTFLQQLRAEGYDRYQLSAFIRSGDASSALTMWDKVPQISLSPAVPFSILRRFCSSLILSLIADGIFDENDFLQHDPVRFLESCTKKEEVYDYIRQAIEQKCAAIAGQRSGTPRSKLIDACLQIIEREYCNPDFNLTVLSAELNVAPNYLSSRFKDEMGVGFMKYRLEKQMEKAKLLLGNPIYKIYSVSGMVGFTDEKYFSKQFKRYTGDSPKDYRNNRTS